MKQVYLEIVNQDSCNASIRGAERQVPYLLTDDMFCAGGGLGHDACSVSSLRKHAYAIYCDFFNTKHDDFKLKKRKIFFLFC